MQKHFTQKLTRSCAIAEGLHDNLVSRNLASYLKRIAWTNDLEKCTPKVIVLGRPNITSC